MKKLILTIAVSIPFTAAASGYNHHKPVIIDKTTTVVEQYYNETVIDNTVTVQEVIDNTKTEQYYNTEVIDNTVTEQYYSNSVEYYENAFDDSRLKKSIFEGTAMAAALGMLPEINHNSNKQQAFTASGVVYEGVTALGIGYVFEPSSDPLLLKIGASFTSSNNYMVGGGASFGF